MIRQATATVPGISPQRAKSAGSRNSDDLLATRVSALLIAGRTATRDVIVSALEQDSAVRIDLTPAGGLQEGLERLRESAFDIVLAAHESGGLENVEALSAIRTGSHARQAILVLGDASPWELEAHCVECGADGYVCLRSTTVRALWCQIVRAIERQQLVQENIRLRHQLQQQRSTDRNEIDRILSAQRALLRDRSEGHDNEFAGRYQPILEAYIMTNGSGLDRELTSLVHDFLGAGQGSKEFLQMHADAVERMVGDLAGRGARHILHQSNLLAMDILLRLSRV